ncbi:GFA family protein [Candidatus Albibeggiatoa sp. nov. BB20]|uniref:GFA family protein n=1 Tax=Candidatus Albibeggiatoa sp. nov. BB20 TaxID=3162723 RepID=UPI0033654ECF
MKKLTGSCLCGTVKIQVPDNFIAMGHCHCSECRKFTGSAFSTAGIIKFDDLHFLEGEEHVTYYWKSESTELGFCRHCGSSLFSKKHDSETCALRLGVLDDMPTQHPAFHIFVDSKVEWDQINDDLTQYKEGITK